MFYYILYLLVASPRRMRIIGPEKTRTMRVTFSACASSRTSKSSGLFSCEIFKTAQLRPDQNIRAGRTMQGLAAL